MKLVDTSNMTAEQVQALYPTEGSNMEMYFVLMILIIVAFIYNLVGGLQRNDRAQTAASGVGLVMALILLFSPNLA